MEFLRGLWRLFIGFILGEPLGEQRPSRREIGGTMLPIRQAQGLRPIRYAQGLRRELDALHRNAVLSQIHANALARQVRICHQRSQALDATARSLVEQGRDDDARSAIRLMLENDHLMASLLETKAGIESKVRLDVDSYHAREADVRKRLEQMRFSKVALDSRLRRSAKREHEFIGEQSHRAPHSSPRHHRTPTHAS